MSLFSPSAPALQRVKPPLLDRLETCWFVLRGYGVLYNCRIEPWTNECKPPVTLELNNCTHMSYTDSVRSPHIRIFRNGV
jgi:hypothetical protein